MTENTGILPIFRDGQSRYPCPETTVHRAHMTHLGNLSRNRSGVVLLTQPPTRPPTRSPTPPLTTPLPIPPPYVKRVLISVTNR